MSVWSCVVAGVVLLGSMAWADGGKCSLTPMQVFTYKNPSPMWLEEYAAIKGDTLEEKSNHARTTLEAKAVAEMQLYAKEKKLAEIGVKLWEALPVELPGMEDHPRERFLKTHQAWREYIRQQAAFIANTSGGGSMYSLIERDVLMKEIGWRIRLYQDILDGKNAVKHPLYFYASKPSSGF